MELARRSKQRVEMGANRAAVLLDEIHRLLVADRRHLPYHTLLIAQVGESWVSPAIFKNRGTRIVYRVPTRALNDVLLDLWEVANEGEQWAEIEFYIYTHRYCVAFTWPDAINPDDDEFDRRDSIVRRYFGDLPIVYPTGGVSGFMSFKL